MDSGALSHACLLRLTCFLGANQRGALALLVNTYHAHEIVGVGQQVYAEDRSYNVANYLCVYV